MPFSRFKYGACALFLLLGTLLPETTLAQLAAPRITLDRQCFTIDGRDTFIYSAAFHYFRCPKPLWRDRFKKLKEAGFNAVETYVPWNWHERTPPKDVDDFSKINLTDFNDWLTMAEDEFGFYTIVRPGPYICAEWDGGGYPQWLTLFRPADFTGMWFRSDDPEYLKWCRHWFTAVAKVTRPHLLTSKPAGSKGVIFWQIENEYSFANKPPKEMLGQLLFLGHVSRELGIDVPLFTCMTHNDLIHDDPWMAANVFECENLYPGFGLADLPKRLAYLDRYQPDKPKMIAELQGGWFATYGNKLSDQQGHTAAQIRQLTLLMWELGFTSTNYYMGFGGTNFGDWAAANLMTTYDYNAPVREAGGVTDRYLAVKELGAFLGKQGDRLVRAEAQPIEIIEKTDREVSAAVRVAKDGTRFVFVRSTDQIGPRQGTIRFAMKVGGEKVITVRYDLEPFGAKVCVLPPTATDGAYGHWYPEPAALPERPQTLPRPIEITTVKRKYDSLPDRSTFVAYAKGKGVEDFGIYDRRTTICRTNVDLSSIVAAGDAPVLNLALSDRDEASVFVDGQRVAMTQRGEREADYRIEHAKSAGSSEVVIVYENGGRPNGGIGMERRNGLSRASFAASSMVGVSLRDWRVHRIENEAPDAFVTPVVDDKAWPIVSVDRDDGEQPQDCTSVYRTTIDLSADDLKLGHELRINRIDDDGKVYVNGKLIGESSNWAERFRADVSKSLQVGTNVIAVVVHNGDGPGGLARGAMLQPIAAGQTTDAEWQFAPGTVGMNAGWSKADLDDSNWESIKLTGRPIEADASAPLAWYRATFALPAKDSHAWVPWKIRLNLTGNAFLYLNGQPLGRYWNAGPQRDFYLPECWLRRGPGETNVLTAAVRGMDKPEFRSATVLPYADQAEKR